MNSRDGKEHSQKHDHAISQEEIFDAFAALEQELDYAESERDAQFLCPGRSARHQAEGAAQLGFKVE